MSSMFKGMDNETLKSMMKMQGMDISDDQISLMKNNMNPNTFKMMAQNSHLYENMPRNSNNNNNSRNTQYTSSDNNSSNNDEPTVSSTPTATTSVSANNNNVNANMNMGMGGMPNFGDLKNMDMASMMKFVQSNPQIMNMMGPQFAGMFGGGNNNGTGGGDQNNMMMKSMENVLWLISLPQRIKAFFSSTRGKVVILFIIVLIIAYFYR